MDVYVRYLREKLDRPFFSQSSFETVRGVGYRLRSRMRRESPADPRAPPALYFALAMAVVLTAVGAVLYLSVREALDGQIAENAVDRIEAIEERDETLGTLLTLLLVIGPVALILASLAGYGVVTAALRPVEAMRRRAEEISTAPSGRRAPAGPPTPATSLRGSARP